MRGRARAAASDAARDVVEATFLAEAEAAGFRHLGGHPLFGGARATLYAGVPDAAVDALVAFMDDFRARHERA